MIFQLILRRLATCFLIGLCAPAVSQTFELSLNEGRVAARQAVFAGDFAVARDFAKALLQADPNDRTALVILAASQPQLGEAREGRRAGARAFRLSMSDRERYEAARLTALAAANEERYTLSQIWLRRAAVNAPDERTFAQTETDYRGIRDLNPWSVNLRFSIAPSSNVNGGSETEFLTINGSPAFGVFDGAARALPGTSASIDLRLAYKVSRTDRSQTSISARGYARNVWLNAEARTIAPDSDNSDFASQVLEFSIDHARRLGDGTVSAQALVGASWFGGDLNRDHVRARLSYGMAVSENSQLEVSSSFEAINLNTATPRTNTGRSLSTAWTRNSAAGNRLTASLSVSDQLSDQVNERYTTQSFQLTHDWADPIGPIQLSATLGASITDYPNYTLLFPVPGGRQDKRVYGSLSATFPEINYAGFVPVVTLGVQDTQSNVSRFTRNEYSMNIGVRSSF